MMLQQREALYSQTAPVYRKFAYHYLPFQGVPWNSWTIILTSSHVLCFNAKLDIHCEIQKKSHGDYPEMWHSLTVYIVFRQWKKNW